MFKIFEVLIMFLISLFAEHPNERDTVIRSDRLLSQLAPLRAFGDVRYKWPREKLQKLIVPYFGDVIAPNYYTPPYLTAKPAIQHHILTPKDKFLVLATDGLWDVFRFENFIIYNFSYSIYCFNFTSN